jgi:Domain of unknown function (DUF5658)
MQRGELGASFERGAAAPLGRATVTLADATPADTTLDDETLNNTKAVMAGRRRAVILGLGVLAVLQAADVLATWALLANDGAEINPVGRALIGSGGAIVVKFAIIGALLALVISRPLVRMGFVCGVWAVTGIYLAVVGLNIYSLHLVGGLG